MNKCTWTDRIEVEDGKLVRIVTAHAVAKKMNGTKLDIYKEDEDGNVQTRSLYLSFMGGYFVDFGDGMEWCEWKHVEAWDWCLNNSDVTEAELEVIYSKYPSYRYTVQKLVKLNAKKPFPEYISVARVFNTLQFWKKHPQIELIIGAGFERVAYNKNFWKLSERKKKEVVSFLRTHPDCTDFTLAEIQGILKHGERNLEYVKFQKDTGARVPFDEWEYLVKIGMSTSEGVRLYHDYRQLLARTAWHDAQDEYWARPKNLREKHDQLQREITARIELEVKEKIARKQSAYIKVAKILAKNILKKEGYTVYVPQDVNDIKEQADRLRQCLITCDYISSVAQRNCILVFVRDSSGNPVATAQILPNLTIGQFYADERDRNNCLPSNEVRTVMNDWLTENIGQVGKALKKAA